MEQCRRSKNNRVPTLFQGENRTVSCLLDWALTAHEAMRKHLMQTAWNRARKNIKTSTGNLKSNLQEPGARECVLSSPSPGSWLRRHFPSPLYSCYKIYVCIFCFQMAFSILSVCQAYPVHLCFQNVFLSKPSKITSYCNWSLLCCFTSYFYALVWFIFPGSITLHHFFATNLSVNPSQVTHVWPAIHQQE